MRNGKRNKLLWPFASDSIWNTAIGSAAAYQAAGIVSVVANGSPTQFSEDEDVIIMSPSAPLTDVYYNGVAWNGGDRCPPQGNVLATIPIPGTYVLPNSGNNNAAAVLLPDGHTVEQNQPLTRCAAGGPATTLVTFSNVEISGPGISGAHGGSGLSALGGTIRLGEFTSGRIHHAMKAELQAAQDYFCCAPHWPATVVDGYANSTTYGGTNPNLGPGSLLALLPSFDESRLATIPGRILAHAFKDYGAYVVDDTAWNAWALATEQGPDGSVYSEFQTLYGYPMYPKPGDPFQADMTAIFEALQVVTNSSPGSVGGGGTPRVPSPPALDDSVNW